jgi:hypothetical protein
VRLRSGQRAARYAAPGAWFATACVAVLTQLGACSRSAAPGLAPNDAAHWLAAACGIRFQQAPTVLESNVVASKAGPGTPASVTAKLQLPDAEVDAALAALAHERSLHRRGQSATRYSYESFPDVRPEKECELDTALHIIYFRYTP